MNNLYWCNSCQEYITINEVSEYLGGGILLPNKKQCNVHPGVTLKESTIADVLAHIFIMLKHLRGRIGE